MANCLLKVGVSAGIFALGIISTRSFFTTRAQLITNDEHYATMKARKNELRKKMKKRLGDVPLDSIAEQSHKITENLKNSKAFQQSQRIGIYISSNDLHEVNTKEIMSVIFEQGKACFAPRVKSLNPADMDFLRVYSQEDISGIEPNNYGVIEPTQTLSNGQDRENALEHGLDLFLVPGVAFDENGGRLGRGKAYYDRYFKVMNQRTHADGKEPLRIALALQEQMVEAVPMTESDEIMHAILTPQGMHVVQK